MRPRPILAGILALLILQALPAANVAPVLSSVGKILFPENSTSAYLQAASGELTVAAGGSNKSVVLRPTGSGSAILDSFGNSPIYIGRRAEGTSASKTAVTTDLPLAQLSGFGYGATGYSSAGRAIIRLNAGENWSDAAQGAYIVFLTTPIGGTAVAEMARIFGSGGMSLGSTTDPGATNLSVIGKIAAGTATAPTYAVDATGDVNVTGVFRKGGTAGTSASYSFRNGAGSGSCSVTVSGGIITAVTGAGC